MNDQLARLTPQEEAFALAMADPTCKGITDAYERAGYSMSGKPETRNRQALKVATKPHVATRIAELRAAAAKPVLDNASAVLAEWVAIATADPAELAQLRHDACRHCHGEGHAYQWVDEAEYVAALAEVERFNAYRKHGVAEKPLPEFGGTGFTPNADPHPECPKCHGRGVLSEWVADTRHLSPGARKLYAGFKRTANGLEVKMRDQDGALANIAKYLGMFVERHAHGGDANNRTPIPLAIAGAALSLDDAAKLYEAITKG